MIEIRKIAAIDVGFGHTKFRPGFGGEDRSGRFPSIVSISDKNDKSLTVDPNEVTNTVLVTVGDKQYRRVGPGVHGVIAAGGGNRIMDESFSASDDYLALLRAALTYMGATQISVLQLGLPMSTFLTKFDALKNAMVGEHKLFRANGEQYICYVKRVEVVPQPIAAYAYHRFYKTLTEDSVEGARPMCL